MRWRGRLDLARGRARGKHAQRVRTRRSKPPGQLDAKMALLESESRLVSRSDHRSESEECRKEREDEYGDLRQCSAREAESAGEHSADVATTVECTRALRRSDFDGDYCKPLRPSAATTDGHTTSKSISITVRRRLGRLPKYKPHHLRAATTGRSATQ